MKPLFSGVFCSPPDNMKCRVIGVNLASAMPRR